ncbi:calcium/proton exchanger [Cryptococcus wingfieldii CBS 7118]|uniref:Calcium/proton exchanger n=1 Tax=Cryptococcus wingfieldii CBS 7118 TaxID=1295528 RepID=A0A1E3K8T5_9TREE|nr:calcium/proton exchanger [Cryptococcus wingfieldii CBS 7118]ODO08937.1 calcium/proton exchanger [Cryptococcus wingfieldii CBS 7118]
MHKPLRRVSFPADSPSDPPAPPLTDSPLNSPRFPPAETAPANASATNLNPELPEGNAASGSGAVPAAAGAGTGPRRRQGGSRQVTMDPNGPDRRETSESARSRPSRRQSTIDPNMGLVRRVTTVLFTPEKRIGKAPTYVQSFKAAICSTWLNVLLVFIPVSWALHFVQAGGNEKITDTAVFITAFIAIIPLAGLLGFATEEAALRLGQTLGGLLNATLGNAVELIVAILALVKCELQVVQSSLVGSILSNILLVLGMCFFAGGVRFEEQTIQTTAAQLNSSLLLIAVIAVLIPSAYHFSIAASDSNVDASELASGEGSELLSLSHGVAILLLILYLGYLMFQMFTHAALYVDDTHTGSTYYPEKVTNVSDKFRRNFHRNKKHDEEEGLSTSSTVVSETAGTGPEGLAAVSAERQEEEEEEEEEVPQMNVITTIGLMVLITVLVGVTSEFLVDSINGLVEAHPSLSAEWVGLILLPIVGNAAEHYTAVISSVKDRMSLSISVAVGSSIQIALFVIPVMELLAWTIGKPMTLLFDAYESIVLFLSVLIVNQTLADGRSNWMEGMVLMMLYIIIAVSFWYYPVRLLFHFFYLWGRTKLILWK